MTVCKMTEYMYKQILEYVHHEDTIQYSNLYFKTYCFNSLRIIFYVFFFWWGAGWGDKFSNCQETQVWLLGQEDPMEEGTATHSSILAWRIPWTQEPAELQSMGSQNSWTWLSD